MEKTDRSHIRKIRYAVQTAVFLMVCYAGATFYLFASALEHGAIPTVSRPPSVEGFLPIGGLMTLKLWLTEGMLDPVHPAAPVILAGAILLSLLVRKSFCGWICPVGTLSEFHWKIGKRIFSRNFSVNIYADYALRSLKYILMFFFLYIILIKMSSTQIVGFLETPYWKVADIKMLRFFTDMSLTTKIVLGLLVVLSFLYKNFWCRYLCPYGGLLGLLGSAGPLKIRRNDSACIHCELCTKNCPSLLPVSKKNEVLSPECTGCLTCVSYCPSKNALDMTVTDKKTIRPEIVAVLIVVIFFGLILAARLGGKWHSSVTPEELRGLIPILNKLGHP